MTVHDRLAELSQRITALTGQTISRDQVMAVADQAFKQQIDLDDDGQLRTLVAGIQSGQPAGSENAASTLPAPTPSAAASGNRRMRWAVVAAVAVLVIAGGTTAYLVIRRASNHCDTTVAAAEEVAHLSLEFTGLADQNLPALKERLSPEVYTQSEQAFRSVSTIPGADRYVSHIAELTSKQVECSGTNARVESQIAWSVATPRNPAPQTTHGTWATTLEYQKNRWIVTKVEYASKH
ncbi:Cell wall synthesis protein CwsA [Mycobacteroides salmoniphilum]|uniref:Cell wall synthesis protein CwsA n=1 Tax=Mycobacteroides salmoniphilum TaxID=404941 RepID=A0A4R8S3S3_9MYCO|nr:cell wall synthesis protein CwsA [Mycobacteroides salmoniphilum]TDZ85479.1 Cell wall synthesis protein CwsA [Mycobacteroides salmoniphilum]